MRIIGHRGACGYAPENTLLSMRKALALSVDGIEFDIQLSADGEPVVMHDDTLERTTSGHGRVSDHTLAALKTFDAGQGERIPSLQDVLDQVAGRCDLFIELKAENAARVVAKTIAAAVRSGAWRYGQLPVCAFDHGQLADIKKIDDSILTCALIAGIPVTLAEIARQAGAWAINPCIHHVNQALVDDARRRGLKVFVWTANEPHEVAKAYALGVDGIISNYPDRARRA